MKVLYFSIVFLLLVLTGCASNNFDSEIYGKAFSNGDYKVCESMVGTKTKKLTIDRKLDAAFLAHYQKDYIRSLNVFNETSLDMDVAFTKSITRGIGAAALNENITSYDGNIYEYLLLNAFNSLNYYNLDNLEEALVEIRKIEIKQKEYALKYGQYVLDDGDYSKGDVSNAVNRMSLRNSGDIYKHLPSLPDENDIYKDSAFAHYLAALMYKEDNSGTPELHAREYNAVNRGLDCASLSDDMNIPAGKGRLDFVALCGKIVERHEEAVYFPDFDPMGVPIFINYIQIGDVAIPPFRFKFVYPAVNQDKTGVLVRPDLNVVSAKVILDNGLSEELKLIESFDMAVQKDVNARARKDFRRSVARSLTKKTTAVVVGAATLSSTPESFRPLAAIGVSASLEAVDIAESADIRQCVSIPSFACGGGFTLNPGVYSGKIEYYDKNSKLVYTDTFDNVSVKAGKPVIVESVCSR